MARPIWRTLGWAAYLGCSWTWCIGMFLPVLLLRDFGVWGFVVFAIPNVVGAAAMGWVVRSPDEVVSIWETHRPAVRKFTHVTVLFHLFFLGWIVWVLAPALFDESRMLSIFPVVAGAALLIVGWLVKSRRDLAAAALVWAASLGLGALMMGVGAWEELRADRAGLLSRGPDASLAFLAPVCVFGFLFCPYLDATFLRARNHLAHARDSRVAFGTGFGVVFFSMIVLTLGYSAALEQGVSLHGRGVPLGVAELLLAHFIVQAIFTMLVHIRAVPGGGVRSVRRPAFAILCVATFALGFGVGYADTSTQAGYAGISLGEVAYRLFMAFYGLVFPAYVWLCMIPTRDGHSGTLGARGKRKLVVLGAAVLIAAPFYWMGFIERETWWLGPGLGAVLVARLTVMGRRAGEVGEDSVRGGV